MDKDQLEKFKTLYDPLHSSLDRFCRMISGNRMDGEDLLHDTVLLTMRNFHEILNHQAMQSYMFTIASNLHKKRAIRRKPQAQWEDKEIAQMVDHNMSPDTAADFRIIHEKILELPKKVSETLLLFYVTDLKIEDIQKIQGGSLSGVKLRLKRGKEKLMRLLNDREQRSLVMLFM